MKYINHKDAKDARILLHTRSGAESLGSAYVLMMIVVIGSCGIL